MQFAVSITRILLAALAAFFTAYVLDVAVNLIWFAEDYAALSEVFRAPQEMQSRLWLGLLIYALYHVLFAGLFARLYAGATRAAGEAASDSTSPRRPRAWILDGLAFGFFMTLLVGAPSALMQYVYYPLPLVLALKWIASGALAQCASALVVSAILHGAGRKDR
jgi:hypothetical protein